MALIWARPGQPPNVPGGRVEIGSRANEAIASLANTGAVILPEQVDRLF
jgi:hypothetical protein